MSLSALTGYKVDVSIILEWSSDLTANLGGNENAGRELNLLKLKEGTLLGRYLEGT